MYNEEEMQRLQAHEQAVEAEDLKLQQESAERGDERLQQLQQSSEQQAQEQSNFEQEIKDNTDEDGKPKPTHQTMEPKEFGLKENLTEGTRAVGAGLIDIWNNTVDLGKYADSNFYKPQKAGDYEFASDWKFENKPMLRTQWGKFLRSTVDLVGGFVGFGKAGWALKGAANVMRLGKLTDRGMKLGKVIPKLTGAQKNFVTGATTGAAVAAWDADSDSGTLSDTLIEISPAWFGNIFTPLATNDDMSPAQRTALTIVESLGIDGGLFAAFGAVTGRKTSQQMAAGLKKGEAKIAKDTGITSPLEAVKKSSEAEYAAKTNDLLTKTEKTYTANSYQTAKKNGLIGEDVTIDQFRETWKTPTKEVIEELAVQRFGQLTPETYEQASQLFRPSWDDLDDYAKNVYMEQKAADLKMDWGENRDFTRKNVYRGEQATDIGVDQLQDDLIIGTARENPYYARGAEAHENQPLSHTTKPVKAIRDQIQIRNDWSSRRGANRAPFTEANIRRMSEGTGGMTPTKEMKRLADALMQDETYEVMFQGPSRQQILDDMINVTADVKEFLEPGGNARASDFSEGALKDFLYSLGDEAPTVIEGVRVMNHNQLVAADVMLGQLTQQMRDLSKAGLSVADQVDISIPGGLADNISARYKALARMRAETSAASSWNLRRFKSGTKPTESLKSVVQEASNQAAQRAQLFDEIVRKDPDLLESFEYFTAASNGSGMTMRDMDAFFNKRLYGYRQGDTYQQAALVNEFATMGINSMLSGPKTQARALFGTGIGTFTKPVATIVGATMSGDRRATQAAFAHLGGMFDSLGDAWRKAVADFNTYTPNMGFRGEAKAGSDESLAALTNYYRNTGSATDKGFVSLANMIHGLNKNPFLNYGPRIMKSMDSFFGQLIARGQARQRAYLEVLDGMEVNQKFLGAKEMNTAVRSAEERFLKNIWTADGELTDSMAKWSWDEAAMKKELTGWAADIQRATEKLPLIKPFVGLFMKTGVNAMELFAKHTPILNRALQESRDIMTKAWDHPDMIQYGIQSADDLAQAKAALKGREAIGFGFVTMGSGLYLNGHLSGNGPPDKKLRQAWIQSGAWQPRSIKVGNTWVSYESLEPFNGILSFIADVGDAHGQMGDAWTENELGKLGHLITANIQNKTFLAGLMNLGDLISGRGQNAGSVAANLVNNQIPLSSLRNEIGKILSPGMRELEDGFIDGVKNRNLWAEFMVGEDGKLPYRYDVLDGKPLRDWDPMTRIVNGVLPFNVNYAASPTREMLFRSGVPLAVQFNTTPDGESLEGYPDLKSRFNFLMSQQGIEQQLEKLFKDPAIIKSIIDMERNHSSGYSQNPNTLYHSTRINQIFQLAKKESME